MELQNRITLITNCSALQGPAIAAEFQRQGAILYLHDVNIERAKPILVKFGNELEGDVHFVQADFSERGDAEREILEIIAETGRLDILVNNSVQEYSGKPLLEINDDEWDSMQRALLTETFYVTKAALKHMMIAKNGKIIIVTSSPGLDGDAYKPWYTAATAGFFGFARALGQEVARYDIQVNVISLHGVENSTHFKDDEFSRPQVLMEIDRAGGVTRLTRGAEEAKLAAFLASDDSDFICAEIIRFASGPKT